MPLPQKLNFAGIYHLYDGMTNQHYVGSSKNVGKRITSHINGIKKGKHSNMYISRWVDSDLLMIDVLENFGEYQSLIKWVGDVMGEIDPKHFKQYPHNQLSQATRAKQLTQHFIAAFEQSHINGQMNHSVNIGTAAYPYWVNTFVMFQLAILSGRKVHGVRMVNDEWVIESFDDVNHLTTYFGDTSFKFEWYGYKYLYLTEQERQKTIIKKLPGLLVAKGL